LRTNTLYSPTASAMNCASTAARSSSGSAATSTNDVAGGAAVIALVA